MMLRPPSGLSRSLADRVIIVTGAASGVGRATAQLLADDGARVGLVDRQDQLLSFAENLRNHGASVHPVVTDVGTDGAPGDAVAQIRDALGPVDGLVNNAGVVASVGIEDPRFDEAWYSSMRVNLTAYAHFVRAVSGDLSRDGNGRVVNVASTEGLGATARQLPYTVAKHGVVGLTRSLAVELGPRGVTVNCVCPGPIETASPRVSRPPTRRPSHGAVRLCAATARQKRLPT